MKKNDRSIYQQKLDDMWYETVSTIAHSIFQGYCSYKDFLDLNPDAKEKEYVDNWIQAHLDMPKFKDKVIPGFND